MTNEERHKLHEDLSTGVRMVTEKLTKMGREKATWSLDEMMKLADIMKDLSSVEKNLAKTHWLLCEHSIEKY